MSKVLQWRYRGYCSNFEELARLIETQLHKAICLQEIYLTTENFNNSPDTEILFSVLIRDQIKSEL